MVSKTTSSKILPNHIWTHTNNNLIILTSFKSLTIQRCIPSATFDDLEVLLQVFRHASHFCHIHSESIIGLDLDEVLTAQAQQTHGLSGAKIPMDEDKLLKWYIALYAPQKKIESNKEYGDTGYTNGQSWKVIKDFSPFYQCIMFSI